MIIQIARTRFDKAEVKPEAVLVVRTGVAGAGVVAGGAPVAVRFPAPEQRIASVHGAAADRHRVDRIGHLDERLSTLKAVSIDGRFQLFLFSGF